MPALFQMAFFGIYQYPGKLTCFILPLFWQKMVSLLLFKINYRKASAYSKGLLLGLAKN